MQSPGVTVFEKLNSNVIDYQFIRIMIENGIRDRTKMSWTLRSRLASWVLDPQATIAPGTTRNAAIKSIIIPRVVFKWWKKRLGVEAESLAT
jgi:hypothetical protein